MRILLLDHYDSYTHNVAQLIAETTGEYPTIMQHDDPQLADAAYRRQLSAEFDALVLSPGPGSPANPDDARHTWAVVHDSALPMLGICLGLQVLVHNCGGSVRRAPAARHGHLSPITHDGQGLWAGMPQQVTMVRYHSLAAVEPLPPELIVDARSEDGVVMGVRHRTQPWWAVQFHPESVASAHGRVLIENFCVFAGQARAGAGSASELPGQGLSDGDGDTSAAASSFVVNQTDGRGNVGSDAPVDAPSASASETTSEQSPSHLHDDAPENCGPANADAHPGALVPHLNFSWREIDYPQHLPTTARRLLTGQRYGFWLDSALPQASARWSFVGCSAGAQAEVLRSGAGQDDVTVEASAGTSVEPGGILAALQRRTRRLANVDVPFPLRGGFVGWFGYEGRNQMGFPVPATKQCGGEGALWLAATRYLCVDHAQRRAYAVAVHDQTEVVDDWWTLCAQAVADTAPSVEPALPPLLTAEQIAPHVLMSRPRYVAAIRRAQQALLAGDSYEICLTTSLRAPFVTDPFDAFCALRRLSPAPYAAYLTADGVQVLSASPERFLTSSGNRMETKPIKGTAPRAADPAEDRRLATELASSAKTMAENLMIVDLLSNDLAQVCSDIQVPSFLAVESYATLHQLVTTVRGTLLPGRAPLDAVAACFPGGSMTGAPKRRTLTILDELEPEPRGVYSGALGWISDDGQLDLSIVIRTVVVQDQQATIGAGGAIVLDSDPDAEYDEMLLKLRAPASVVLQPYSGV